MPIAAEKLPLPRGDVRKEKLPRRDVRKKSYRDAASTRWFKKNVSNFTTATVLDQKYWY
jgi:hypothetical protein